MEKIVHTSRIATLAKKGRCAAPPPKITGEKCPAAQSVIGCNRIAHSIDLVVD